ncbi:glycosyl hydrolase family 28 protein [Halogeometricum sp. S1BR25-6]|uniref:Glycosyl hydrolase family 28 protein n=1 Tax=Halogeometricum salsisoli TaxID=2950536 RepID=A0ABU2GIK2_9EURY|nr:glycosyl hydrolase family 28 protein [Halogeometricum sp. S1BR25-6]MDS0300640.1 glycosyl hydrolase family 28 protein [Halogeometricum sp. S1BR25-6]
MDAHSTVSVREYDDDAETDTDAFQRAINACADGGGGTVAVPAGEYVVGTVRLRSHVSLELAAGATVFAAFEESAYDDARVGPDGERPFLVADGVENVAVEGRGTFDGRGTEFMLMDTPIRGHSDESDAHPLVSNGAHRARQGDAYLDRSSGTDRWPAAKPDFRPGPMFLFEGCEDVLVRGVTLRDMPAWTLSVHDSEEVDIVGVDVHNHPRIPNCDGVSVMNSRNVHVSDCTIRTCDDAITVGTLAESDRPTEGVTVTNCTLASSACAIKFGSETARDVRNCTFENCVVTDSNRGLGIQHRDGGAVENVLFSNIVVETRLLPGPWWGKGEPIYVTSVPRDESTSVGPVRNVRFSNVVARSENGALVYAHESADVRGVRFDGVEIEVRRGEHADAVGGNFDLQPTSVVPPIQERDIAALHVENASDVDLRDLSVEWEGDVPDYFENGLRCVGVEGLRVDGFAGRQAHRESDAAAVDLRAVDSVSVRNCRAQEGTGTFLAASDVADARLFAGNDLADATAAVAGDADFRTNGNLPPR